MSRPIQTATPISSSPMATDAAGSQIAEPVSWSSPMPTAAMAMPASAALSSNRTILTFGSRVART